MSVAEPAERSPYRGYRFPPRDHCSRCVAVLPLSSQLPRGQDVLAERGIIVSHETIRQWCTKFGTTSWPGYADDEYALATSGIWTRWR